VRHRRGDRSHDVRVVRNDVTADPLPPEIERIAVCNLDVDMYESIAAGLRRVAPLVVPGGIIVVERSSSRRTPRGASCRCTWSRGRPS
jgi:Macrocin-O-methyltransferase (TylF)